MILAPLRLTSCTASSLFYLFFIFTIEETIISKKESKISSPKNQIWYESFFIYKLSRRRVQGDKKRVQKITTQRKSSSKNSMIIEIFCYLIFSASSQLTKAVIESMCRDQFFLIDTSLKQTTSIRGV